MTDSTSSRITLGRTCSNATTAPALNAVMTRMAAIETRIEMLEDMANHIPATAPPIANPTGIEGGHAAASAGRARIGLGRPLSPEMQLVEAIKALQEHTRQPRIARGVVGSHLSSMGLPKVFKFGTICRNAERMGLVVMGYDGPTHGWIALA